MPVNQPTKEPQRAMSLFKNFFTFFCVRYQCFVFNSSVFSYNHSGSASREARRLRELPAVPAHRGRRTGDTQRCDQIQWEEAHQSECEHCHDTAVLQCCSGLGFYVLYKCNLIEMHAFSQCLHIFLLVFIHYTYNLGVICIGIK